jgi:hypothetical protein
MSQTIHAVPADEPEDNYDPLDPESHKVTAAPDYPTADKKLIAVRKPRPREFFRSHPDPAFRRDIELYEYKGKETELYVVHRDVEHLFEGETIPVRLITSINKTGVVFLSPIRIWEDESRWSKIFHTAMNVVKESETTWVRRIYNQDAGGYEWRAALGDLGEPQWGDRTFKAIFGAAFDGKVINSAEHAVVQELRGQK